MTNYVSVRWPVALELLHVIGKTDSRHIVGQSVEPDINDWRDHRDGNAPRALAGLEATRYREIA